MGAGWPHRELRGHLEEHLGGFGRYLEGDLGGDLGWNIGGKLVALGGTCGALEGALGGHL